MQCRLMPRRAWPAQRGCRRLGRSGWPSFPSSRTLSDWLVSRPQLSVTPATAARRSGGRGSSPTSRGRAELVAVDCSTRVVRVPCDTSLYSELGAERARGWPSLVVSPACCFTRNIITCLPPHTAPAVRRRRAPPLAAAQNAHAHLGPELRDGDSQAFTGLTFHTHRLAPRGSCQLLSFREIDGYNLDRHASDKGTYKASSSHSSTVGGASWGQVTIYIYIRVNSGRHDSPHRRKIVPRSRFRRKK